MDGDITVSELGIPIIKEPGNHSKRCVSEFLNMSTISRVDSKNSKCVAGKAASVMRKDIPMIKHGDEKSKFSNYVFLLKNDGTYFELVFFKNKRGELLTSLTNFVHEEGKYHTLTFLNVNVPKEAVPLYNGTVFCGELMRPTVNSFFDFYIFDCRSSCGQKCYRTFFCHRLDIARGLVDKYLSPSAGQPIMIDSGIDRPYAIDTIHEKVSREMLPIEWLRLNIHVKPAFLFWGLKHFYSNMVKELHSYDGFIFQKRKNPYEAFMFNEHQTFKFKQRMRDISENTIDVRITLTPQGCETMPLPKIPMYLMMSANIPIHHYDKINDHFSCQGNVDMSVMGLGFDWYLLGRIYAPSQIVDFLRENKSMNEVFEMEMDVSSQTWSIMRKRDKSPNRLVTVLRTVLNIVEDIKISEFFIN